MSYFPHYFYAHAAVPWCYDMVWSTRGGWGAFTMGPKTLKAFQAAVGNFGRAIRMDLEFTNGSREAVEFGPELAPRLVQSLIQAAAASEKMRKGQAGSPTSLTTPWRATDAQAGTVIGTEMVAIGFKTAEGPPVQLVMSKGIAVKTIQSILAELKASAAQG